MSEVQVETFECQETMAEPIEATEEAVAIIEQLGLQGQKGLIAKRETTGRDSRCPYREIRADEEFVYGVLCPEHTKIDRYSASPIPLRVLQLAAHAREFVPHLYVWHQPSAVVKDPVLIGQTTEITWGTGFKRLILARWGEELESFPVLLKRAFDQHRARLIQELEQTLATVRAATEQELIRKGADKEFVW